MVQTMPKKLALQNTVEAIWTWEGQKNRTPGTKKPYNHPPRERAPDENLTATAGTTATRENQKTTPTRDTTEAKKHFKRKENG